MELRTKAATYGMAGLIAAGVLILASNSLGILSEVSSGALAIMLTDPPTVPDGVSAVYLSYSSLAVHVSGLGDSGWVATGSHGTIETLGLVNLSQTISTGTVPSLSYNLLSLTITGANVTFLGMNYTATVSSGKLTIPIVGGLRVDSSNPAAAVVDLQPTVLNLGNQTDPDFALSAGAKAVQVPPGQVVEPMLHLNNKSSLKGRGWYDSFAARQPDVVAKTGIALTSHSLTLNVTNSGPDPVDIRMVIVTSETPSMKPKGLQASLADSAVFVVEPDHSLQLLTGGTGDRGHTALRSALEGTGYVLAAGATVTLSFSGLITEFSSTSGLTAGATYYVVVLGSHTLSVQPVTAG